MGYRPNIVKEYKVEYGDTLSGYNYDVDGLSDFLDELGVEYSVNDAMNEHEISSADLLALEDRLASLKLNEHEEDNLRELIKVAKHSKYATDFVKIHWF